MPREIKSNAEAAAIREINSQPNDYKDRLVKLIPSEIVAAYVPLQGLIMGLTQNQQTIMWIVFVCLLALVPLYLNKITAVKKPGQLAFSTLAFAIWVLALGGFTVLLPGVTLLNANVGSIILILYTLFIPFVYKG